MPGKPDTQMSVRIPYFLLDILKTQKTTPITTSKIYCIGGMYFDKFISSTQCDYFINHFQDPKASKKLQFMKDLIDEVHAVDKKTDDEFKRKKAIVQKKFIRENLKLLIKSPTLTFQDKESCEQMVEALEKI